MKEVLISNNHKIWRQWNLNKQSENSEKKKICGNGISNQSHHEHKSQYWILNFQDMIGEIGGMKGYRTSKDQHLIKLKMNQE